MQGGLIIIEKTEGGESLRFAALGFSLVYRVYPFFRLVL